MFGRDIAARVDLFSLFKHRIWIVNTAWKGNGRRLIETSKNNKNRLDRFSSESENENPPHFYYSPQFSLHFLNREEIKKTQSLSGYKGLSYPTSPFPILEPQNPWIDEFDLVREHRATDFKAPKLRKGSSTNYYCLTDFRLESFPTNHNESPLKMQYNSNSIQGSFILIRIYLFLLLLFCVIGRVI